MDDDPKGYKHGERIRSIDKVRVRQVVEVEFVKGAGTETDVVRRVWRYYGFDGRLLAEKDEHPGDV